LIAKFCSQVVAIVQALQQMRRFVQTVLGILFRHPVTGISIIPRLPDGQIVMIQRRDNGLWALPGGFVDWGESIPTTVRRELLEETGLELVEIQRLVGVYSSPDRDPRIHSICVVVEASVRGTIRPQDTLEVGKVRAFQPDNLPPPPLSHDSEQHLQDYFAGRTVLD